MVAPVFQENDIAANLAFKVEARGDLKGSNIIKKKKKEKNNLEKRVVKCNPLEFEVGFGF